MKSEVHWIAPHFERRSKTQFSDLNLGLLWAGRQMNEKIQDFIDDYVIGRYADSFLKQLAEIEKGTLINASAFSGTLTNDDSVFVSWNTYPDGLGMVIFLLDDELGSQSIYMSEHRISELGLEIS